MKPKRRKAQSTSLVRASISFPPDLYTTLGELAKEKKVSLAWVVREAEAQEILPMLRDKICVRLVGGDAIERPVISLRIDPPESCAGDIGDARAELVTQQPEDSEDHIGIRPGVRHELGRPPICRRAWVVSPSAAPSCLLLNTR